MKSSVLNNFVIEEGVIADITSFSKGGEKKEAAARSRRWIGMKEGGKKEE